MSAVAYRLTLIGGTENTPCRRLPGTVRGLTTAAAEARSWLICHPEHALVAIHAARSFESRHECLARKGKMR